MLIYFTWKEIRTEQLIYEQLRRFWTKIFAVSIVIGTVTGLVLEFEFETNFAAFSRTIGELFGGPLALEGMMVFMLEATFLGIFVFGRDCVSDRFYFLSSIAVGLGTWLLAVWILIANSRMQTPRGFDIVVKNGHHVVKFTDPIAAYLNPRFPYMFVHMQNAAVESAALFMAGVAALSSCITTFSVTTSGARSSTSTSGRKRSRLRSSCSLLRHHSRSCRAMPTLATLRNPTSEVRRDGSSLGDRIVRS